MASAAPAIERREIGGVPVFWSEAPLPFTAGLVFRAGRADETLRSAGLCHLLEHLVVPVTEVAHLEFNAVVDNVETAFFATGRRERVLAFLTEICRMVGAPAFERLETERSILTTEAASAGGAGPVGGCAALRFGPVGQGLLGYDEYGLNWIGERELDAWARTRFTRGSCAVWLSGDPGDELELELAAGARIQPPGPKDIEGLVCPSYFGHGPSGGISLSFVGERSLHSRSHWG